MLRSVLLDSSLVDTIARVVLLRQVAVERIGELREGEEAGDAIQNRAHTRCRRPVAVQDRVADAAAARA